MPKHFESHNRQLLNKVSNIIANSPENTRYQNWLIVFLLILSFSLAFKKQSIEYFFMNPFFNCDFSLKIVNEDGACGRLHQCTIKNQHTLTVQMGLYCERKHERTFIQSLRGIGGWVGTILVGIIADNFGRKLCMMISLISLNLSFLTLIVGALTHSMVCFMISQFLEGVGNKFIFSISLLYMTRFMRKRMYESVTNLWYLIGGGLSHICLAIANQLIHNWFLVTLISFVPLCGLLIACPIFIKEDPIYLFENDKSQEFKREVTWINQFNGKSEQQTQQDLRKIDELQEDRQQLLQEIKRVQTCADICNMFCLNKGLLVHTLVLGVIHITCDFTYHGINLSMQTLGYSYNVNIFILGCAQIIASIIMIKILTLQDNRRRGFIIVSSIGSILAILMLLNYVQKTKIVMTILIFLIDFFMTFVMAFSVRVEMDSFPEKMQVTLMSIIQIFSTTSQVMAPSLVQFGVDHNFNNITFTHIIRLVFGTIPMCFINDKRHEIDPLYVQGFEQGQPPKQESNQLEIDEEIKQQ